MSTTKRPPEFLQPPHDRPEPMVLHRAWKRLNKKNEHFMLALVGEEGIGKSLTALRIAKEIDPQFDVGDVIFDAGELLRRLKDEDYRAGQAIVLDEAGVSLGRRTWQDRGQVMVNQALQLIRSHNIAVIFTLPRLGELDSQTVGRLQAFFEITKKVPDEYVVGKWKYIDPDRSDENGVNYKKYPRWNMAPEEPTVVVQSMAFRPPEGDWVDEYHDVKAEHQKQVYADAIAELEGEDVDDEAESIGPKEVAKQIAEDGIGPYVARNGSTKEAYLNKDLIRVDYDLSHSDATAVKKLLERTFTEEEIAEKA